jgi:hypothetical protein
VGNSTAALQLTLGAVSASKYSNTC